MFIVICMSKTKTWYVTLINQEQKGTNSIKIFAMVSHVMPLRSDRNVLKYLAILLNLVVVLEWTMVRLTADVLLHCFGKINPCLERELDIRGLKIPAIENVGVTQVRVSSDFTSSYKTLSHFRKYCQQIINRINTMFSISVIMKLKNLKISLDVVDSQVCY